MKYEHILWCNEDNHDKVWGMIRIAEVNIVYTDSRVNTYKYVTFWGRRGMKLQTKIADAFFMDAEQQRDRKLKRGYKIVSKSELDAVYPEFEEDLEKTAVWAMLRS
jgi:hypothetical protein